jgi:hypothetical protein
MTQLRSFFSIYIVLVMLGIGCYMALWQSKTLSTVNHLDKEALFTKCVGFGYIILAIIGAIFLILD